MGGCARAPQLSQGVRPPKVKMNVDLAHALYAIGRLPGEDLPGLALELLSKGIDTSAVRELAGLRRPTVRDAGPVFERVLADLGRPTMPVEVAGQVIARDLARRVVAGEMSPREAAQRGSSLSTQAGYPDVLTRFLAYADDYECFPDRQQAIDAQVIGYANELLAGESDEVV